MFNFSCAVNCVTTFYFHHLSRYVSLSLSLVVDVVVRRWRSRAVVNDEKLFQNDLNINRTKFLCHKVMFHVLVGKFTASSRWKPFPLASSGKRRSKTHDKNVTGICKASTMIYHHSADNYSQQYFMLISQLEMLTNGSLNYLIKLHSGFKCLC